MTARELILQVAREAGQLLLDSFEQEIRVAYKGPYDLVTEVDHRSEALIVDAIRAVFPDHDILAEEGEHGRRRADHCWIIDPLDGTTNYAHGYPWFAVSIALEVCGQLELGVVYNPYVEEFYFAEQGRGAFLNQRPLQVSSVTTLEKALLATGFAYDHKTSAVNNYDFFTEFQRQAQACRRPGVASLDLASVAAGRFDGFWEMKLKPWDLAAGVLLITEAGGRVSDFDGRPMSLYGLECLASNGHIHEVMQDILQHGKRPGDV